MANERNCVAKSDNRNIKTRIQVDKGTFLIDT